jgi:hypothetical protein
MAAQNPFADDDSKGELWERGYLAGFNEPDVDHVPGPFSQELLDVHKLGETAGRQDRAAAPPNSDGATWVGPDFDFGELPEHILIHGFGVALEKIGVAAGGLIALVLTVVTIPGDVQLRPLEPDEAPLPLDPTPVEGNSYVAVCPRTDHPMVLQGVTSDGYWAAGARDTFVGAVADMKAHGHAEAFVARCSVSDKTCGPVWPIQ